jgi:hypothetical protein
MLVYYSIVIPGLHDLQRVIANLTVNCPPSLYALSNVYIGTNLSKKVSNFIGRNRWSDFPINIRCAALDARFGFEIAWRCWQLVGYNRSKDHLNVNVVPLE